MKLLSLLSEYLFAPRAICQGCGSVLGSDQGLLCSSCYSKLQPLYLENRSETSICQNCGGIKISSRCPSCHMRLTGTLRAFASYEYVEPIRHMIHALKFMGTWRVSEWMAGEMLKTLKSVPQYTATAIVPVPLHPLRKLQRGYNQSEKIAFELSKLIDVPVKPLLKRTKYTHQQAKLDANSRRKALKGAFKADSQLSGERILLLDDVRTTGTTLIRCAEALFQAGAEEVAVITLAVSLKKTTSARKYHPDKGVGKMQSPPADGF